MCTPRVVQTARPHFEEGTHRHFTTCAASLARASRANSTLTLIGSWLFFWSPPSRATTQQSRSPQHATCRSQHGLKASPTKSKGVLARVNATQAVRCGLLARRAFSRTYMVTVLLQPMATRPLRSADTSLGANLWRWSNAFVCLATGPVVCSPGTFTSKPWTHDCLLYTSPSPRD